MEMVHGWADAKIWPAWRCTTTVSVAGSRRSRTITARSSGRAVVTPADASLWRRAWSVLQ